MKYSITWFPFSVLKSFKLHRQHNALHIKSGFLPHFHTSKLNLVLHISSGNTAVITHCLLPKQWGFCSEGSPYPARQIKATRHTQCVCSTAVPQPFLQVLKAKQCPFQTGWWPFPSSALPQPPSYQHWAQLPNYTGFGDHHSAELPSIH